MNALRWIALVMIAAIASARCMIAFSPQVWFDVDPAFDPNPLAGMGMGESLILDVLLLLACALGLLGEHFSKRNLDWRLLALALIPALIVLHHAWRDAGDLWRGSTWLAAAVAAATVAHLARDRIMRAAMLGLLMAATAPLLVRGALQVTIEHADTVALFEANREAFLAERGWELDSPQAQIFERRLRQAQPTGWFPTTNIFASVMVVGLIVSAGFLIGAVRAKLASGLAGAMAIVILACSVALVLTGSKGAMGAAVIGLAIALLPLASSRLMNALPKWGPPALLALIPLTLLAVVARGVILPEGFLHEKSLLFRWHYLVSSARMFLDSRVFGVGPDGFQAAYTLFRLPRNPEEVISAHSMFIDWLTTLGALGAAWCAMTVVLLWRAGDVRQFSGTAVAAVRMGVRTGETPVPPENPAAGSLDASLPLLFRGSVLASLLAFAPAIMAELHVLGPVDAVLRLIGFTFFVALAVTIAMLSLRLDDRIVRWSIAAAVGGLIVHGQIEMTFFQPGSVVWAMCLLGLAGAGAIRWHGHPARATTASVHGQHTCATFQSLNPGLALVPALLAIWMAATGAVPALVQQSSVRAAAATLIPFPNDPQEQARRRVKAAEQLYESHELLSTNVLPLHAAVRQYELAAQGRPPERQVLILTRSLEFADLAVTRHRNPASHGIRAGVAAHLAMLTREDRYWEVALADMRRLTEIDPHGIQPWQSLGDLLWLAGRRSEAAEAYRRALEADANFVLDELKRMPPGRRELIEQRLREADASPM